MGEMAADGADSAIFEAAAGFGRRGAGAEAADESGGDREMGLAGHVFVLSLLGSKRL